MRKYGAACLLALGLGGGAWSGEASAQLFHLYLNCEGSVIADGRKMDARIDLAMRDNNQIALIQNSNVLPVGEALKYVPTQQAYTMVYRAPLRGTAVFRSWYGWPLFVWYPALNKLAYIRIAIDRQSGELNGDILNARDEVLASLELDCEPSTAEQQPAPRF